MSNLSLVQIQAFAQSLFVAGNNVCSIAPICDDLSVADAYLVQDAFTLLQQNRGNSLIGYKMGLTNQAKMDLANVCEPLKGQLFANMLLKYGDSLSLSELIQPRVEPEIAFVLRDELSGDDLTVVDVINATEYITGAITDAVSIKVGDEVSAEFSQLGNIAFSVIP